MNSSRHFRIICYFIDLLKTHEQTETSAKHYRSLIFSYPVQINFYIRVVYYQFSVPIRVHNNNAQVLIMHNNVVVYNSADLSPSVIEY